MPKLENITVELQIPFVGKVAGTWAPDTAERQASWELYVELATRVTTRELPVGEGLLRESLSSQYSIFETTRRILREHGPGVALPSGKGDLSFAYLAMSVLEGALRPLLTTWHPRLTEYEVKRPETESAAAWERHWTDAAELRTQLERTRRTLMDYAAILAQAAGVSELHRAIVAGYGAVPVAE